MEAIKLADQDEIFDLCDQQHRQKKKNRKQRLQGRLRKAGLEVGDLSREHMIMLNAENFRHIAEEQLRHRRISSLSDPHFEELPLMKEFDEELGLNRAVWSQMAYFKIENPLPVQRVVIPYITQTNCDLLVRAQAGSGKTFTYLLPIVDKIIEMKRENLGQSPNNRAPYAVIVAPTIELTMQIAKDAARIVNGNVHNVRVTFAVGGQDGRDFEKSRRQGCDILVTTPGKLWSLFLDTKGGAQQAFFSHQNIQFVVLDEADRLADDRLSKDQSLEGPGSFRKIMYDFIVNYLTKEKQKLDFRLFLFGATKMDQDFLLTLLTTHNSLYIQVGRPRPVSTVIQSFIKINAEFEKLDRLMDIMENFSEEIASDNDGPTRRIGKTIIFVNNKRLSDRLAHTLITHGYAAKSINSDRSARQRYEAVQELLNNEIDVLVSSSGLLARGMNFPNVDFVINYDFPQSFNYDEYHHRISRVGRIGNVGKAITFFNPSTDYYAAPDLIKGCDENGQPIPQVLQECADHYFRNNNTNMYSQSNYTPRRQFYNAPRSGRKGSLGSEHSPASTSNNSSRQTSPTHNF